MQHKVIATDITNAILRTANLLSALVLSGCAYSIQDVDVSRSDPVCVRQCTATYSACVSGPQVGFKTETLRACRDGYAVCARSCSSK